MRIVFKNSRIELLNRAINNNLSFYEVFKDNKMSRCYPSDLNI